MGLDMYVTIRHKETQSKLDAYEAWENKYSYEEFQRLTEYNDTLDTLNCGYGFALNSDLVTGEYKGDYIIEYSSSW